MQHQPIRSRSLIFTPSLIFCLILGVSSWFINVPCVQAQELPDFSKVVESSGRAVVNITTSKKGAKKLVPDDLRADLEGTPLMGVLKQMFGDKLEENLSGRNNGLGSGSIISPEGYIITNAHVIEGADEILVRLKDRREFTATVVGMDSGTDLALLKIKAENLPTIAFADSNLAKVGEWVLAIGSPYGFENTVTVGVVSATGRSLGTERYVPFIQTDTAINPGNSGGPLLNLKGEMIGVNAQIISESGSFAGLSFAVPANIIKAVVAQLKVNGSVTRGWLGLAFQNMDKNLAESFGQSSAKGALISQVMLNSPAAKAGLREGDIITDLNGKEIISATDLPPIVGLLPIDSQVKIKIVRASKNMEFTVTLKKLMESDIVTVSKEYKPTAIEKMHQDISVRDLQSFEMASLGQQDGVKVDGVQGESWIGAGVRKGDIIVSVGNKTITNSNDFYQKLRQETKEGHIVPILISRPGDVQRYLAVKFGS